MSQLYAEHGLSVTLFSCPCSRDKVGNVISGIRSKRTGLLLSDPKSSFQMKVDFALC